MREREKERETNNSGEMVLVLHCLGTNHLGKRLLYSHVIAGEFADKNNMADILFTLPWNLTLFLVISRTIVRGSILVHSRTGSNYVYVTN